MNSDGDYLWDKTGEPDPEIQQLEEILGTLRAQPRPLEIPADLKTDPRPRFLSGVAPLLAPRFAIAATLVIALLGLGLWLGLQRLQRGQPPSVVKVANTPAPDTGSTAPNMPVEKQDQAVAPRNNDQQHRVAPRRDGDNATLAVRKTNRRRNQTREDRPENPQLAIREMQEGKAAKDQLMLALRVASAKLSFAQKKTQSPTPKDPVHNQHKIG